jgi:3-methyladenine DNA glycosylase Tag
MSPSWTITQPKTENEYFERMTKTIFNAGLNWKVVDQKWPNFRKAFNNFSPSQLSKLTEKEVKILMKNPGIVRNERKIRATISNAAEFMKLQEQHGTFKQYLLSFHGNESGLETDLQNRFQHLGPSTARMFLWSVKYPLTPNAEERKWMRLRKSK